MLALFLIISPHTIFSLNLYCASSDCKLCISGYNYQNISCLDQCPTKFSQVGLLCLSAFTDKTLYLGEFVYEKNFTQICVGVFCHPLGLPFSDPARNSPITTIDRGFYFCSTSRLTSTPGWVLAPDMFLGMMIAIITDGTIFEARLSQSLVLKIEAVLSNLIYSVLLYSSGSLQIRTISIPFTYNTWINFKVLLNQSKASSILKLILGQTLTEQIIYQNHEFRMQDPNINYYLGSSQGGSFEGFLNKLIIRNSALSILNVFTPANCFSFNSYMDGTTCKSCLPICPTWPWCISASCNICYSNNCGSCNGYGYKSCTSCTNGKTAPGCDMGKNCQQQISTFSCTLCNSGTLISGICVNTPYRYPSATAVIDIKFNEFTMLYGGIFKSGSNENTWGPDHNPESDDPIPLKDRGLYFDGISTYLEAKSPIPFSPTSTVAGWAYPMNGGYIYYKHTFRLSTYLVVVYTLYNYISKPVLLVTNSANEKFNTWVYFVISNNLQSGISTFTISVQMLPICSYSMDGYAMYEINNIILPRLGSGPVSLSPFEGYIYSFTLWQTYEVDLSYSYNICGIELVSSCLSSCLMKFYYNKYQGICLPCDIDCTQGCLSWGTCQKCADIKCNSCSDYVSSCMQANSSPCILPLKYKSGNCCTDGCLTCFGPYDTQCLSCNPGMYLLGNICVTTCPMLYTQSNGICTKITKYLTILILNQIVDSYTDARSGLVFSTGEDSSFYPTLKPSDPIPAKNRGYYFLNTSYMYTQNFILSYNYTLQFWLKHLQPGALFSKGSLTITTGMKVVFTNFNYHKAGCINKTDWMLLTMKFTTNCQSVFSYTLSSSLYSTPIASFTVNNTILDVDSTNIILGNSGTSFTGFLYRFDLIDYDPDQLKFGYAVCSNSISTDCLWDCDLQQFYENSACVSCTSTCSQGCIRSADCNLCHNSICIECSDFGIGCNKCYQSLTVDKVNCRCLEGYYWANTSYFPYTQDCVKCDVFCKSCSTANSCDTCQSNSHLNSLSKCVCDSGYFYNDSSASCMYCGDICESCSTSSQCDKCMNNSYLSTEFNCLCNVGYYLDANLNICKNCPNLCLACSSLTSCNECINNSHIDPEVKCVCDKGYTNINNTCSRSYFTAFYNLSPTNDITLLFSEALSRSLTVDDLELAVKNNIEFFTLKEIDLQRYFINLKLQQAKSELLIIFFKKALTSINNSLLSTISLTISLNFTAEGQITAEINQLQGASKFASTAALSAGIGGSIINLNPNSLFTFLNCLEIFRYTVLFDLELDSGFIQVLTSMQPTSILPNIFEYFISESQGVLLSGKFADFGYHSNLILLNSGISVSIILILFFFALIVLIINMYASGWLKRKLKQVTNKFKFYIFLKIFIQIYLELLLSSCIGIIYTGFDNITQVVNFIICCIFLATIVFGSLFILFLIKKRMNTSNEDEFLKKYGMLFEESKDKNASERLFYCFFIFRRVVIALSTFVITTNVLQLSLNITISLGVISNVDKHVFAVCKTF